MKLHSNKGSLLIVAMILAIGLAICAASYLQLSMHSLKRANRAFYYNAAVNVAEAGAEEAIWALNKGDWSARTWTGGTDKLLTGSYASPDYTDPNGIVAYFNGFVKDATTNNPIITAEANVRLANGTELKKQIRLYAQKTNLLIPPFTAIEDMTLNGGDLDSYRMADGKYTTAPRRYETTVASPTVTIADVSIGSPADIYGHVSVGISSTSSTTFVNSIKGSLTSATTSASDPSVVKSGSNLVDTSLISYDFKQDYPMPKLPTTWAPTQTSLPAVTNGFIVLGVPNATTPTQYDLTSATISKDIVVVGPVQIRVVGNLDVKSTGSISILTGSVTNSYGTITGSSTAKCDIYAYSDVSISGNGSAVGLDQMAQSPAALTVYGMGTNSQKISVGGNGNFAGILYAPKAQVTFNGGGSSGYFAGAVIGRTITVNGQNYRIRFPEELANQSFGETYEIAKWVELTNRADWYSF